MTPALERSRVLRAAIAAAALVVALALVACGGSDADGGDSNPAAGSIATPAATAKFPVTVEHKFGTTEIPAEPKRIVTVGFNEHDFALALGVKPVGVREFI